MDKIAVKLRENAKCGCNHSDTDTSNIGSRCKNKKLFLHSVTKNINWIETKQLLTKCVNQCTHLCQIHQ